MSVNPDNSLAWERHLAGRTQTTVVILALTTMKAVGKKVNHARVRCVGMTLRGSSTLTLTMGITTTPGHCWAKFGHRPLWRLLGRK